MDIKKNDKYKKRYILKQVTDKLGYYEFNGDIVLVKNCIKKNKYNKIYQLIFNGGEAIDGLYLINSYDINLHYGENSERLVRITSKKYDKIAGYDDCSINSFPSKKEYYDWLMEEKYITDEDLIFLKSKAISKDSLKKLQRFILDS